jgi:Uma2 family endonuclease
MSLINLSELASQLELHSKDLEERFITSQVSWYEYESLLTKLGDRSGMRVTYFEGTLEIMSPSRRHERIKSLIGSLLEAYFQEKRIPYFPFGSATFRLSGQRGGTEPDECYCIDTEKDLPDLAIEVVVSTGGVSKLSVYQVLGIKEVWFWQNGIFEVYTLLQKREYQQVSNSILLPDLDLKKLATYAQHSDPLDALLDWRQKLSQNQNK